MKFWQDKKRKTNAVNTEEVCGLHFVFAEANEANTKMAV